MALYYREFACGGYVWGPLDESLTQAEAIERAPLVVDESLETAVMHATACGRLPEFAGELVRWPA